MYEDIIKRHRPRGWKVYHSKRRTDIALAAKAADEKGKKRKGLIDCAITDFESRTIRAPRVVCEYTLQILLHEFAHVKLKHIVYVGEPTPDSMPLHKMEYEADEWAMTIMRLEGIKVTRAIKISAKRYLQHCIAKDLKEGNAIHIHIARKAKLKEKDDE